MIPLRRNVSLVMDKDTYKKLGTQPNTEKAWKLARRIVGDEILRREFVAVPNIEGALYYNQLFVFKKQMNPCSMLNLRPPRFKIFNNLDNLLNIEFSPWIPEFDFTPWNTSDASRMYTYFKLMLMSSPDEPLQKLIEITIREPHVRSANAPVPGYTTLRRTSSRAYIIYVITSVVLANRVSICVTIGRERTMSVNSRVIPVGFKYKKYRVLRNGVFDREIPTVMKFTDREAVWLRPTDMSILRDPLWDPMRRRHDGRRPTRNILTMATTSRSSPSLESVNNFNFNRPPPHANAEQRNFNFPFRFPAINPDELQFVFRRITARNHPLQQPERALDVV